MSLPKPPLRRRVPGFPPPRGPQRSTSARLRGMVREHEEEERPFDPERPGSWRGSSRELVVNPDQFERDLRELVDTSKLAEPDDAFDKAKEILTEGGNPNDVMDEMNELLDMHGVEAFPSQKLPRPDFLYLNSGDTYNATLVYSYDENKYFVSTAGDIIENAEPEMETEAWDSWLEGEVRKDLAREIEGQSSLSEAATEKIVDGLDDIESADLHMKFVGAVGEVGGQVTFESDGSVFVYRQKEAIEALASEMIDQAGKVPEQESFGFNPRRRKNTGAMGREDFIMLVRSELGDKQVRFSGSTLGTFESLYVNFINLPQSVGGAGGGAEAENNRMMFRVDGWGPAEPNLPPPRGVVRVEQMVSALPREYRLRAKAGEPRVIARYLADFINKVAAAVPPKYTHTREPKRAPNARMTAHEVIRASRAAGGTSVVLDRFTYEDEQALADAAKDWRTIDDESSDHTIYEGDGWCVELVGTGDPR